MGLFNRWSRSRPAAASGTAQIRSELERFARDALAHVNRVQVDREVRKQKLVIAFFFGAIDELARAEGVDETHALAASVMFLNHYFPASAAELGSVTALRQEFAEAPQAKNLMREGAEAVKRWRAGDAAPTKWLAESLAFDDGTEATAARHGWRDRGLD
jgi:hypothetical protein